MNMYDTTFRNSLSWILSWSFTENKWLRRFLGLTYVPITIITLIILSIIISPVILWTCTLKDLTLGLWDALLMIREWF